MPCTRMAIPLRYIATGEGHVRAGASKKEENMGWTSKEIARYHQFAKQYISTYGERIDCADLAISALIDFASKNKLPVKLKYFRGGWKWIVYNPSLDNAVKFRNNAMRMLGALNIIDNTIPIFIGSAEAGDFIMSKWNSALGHTRIIYSIDYKTKENDFSIVWYQGNLPPVKPEKRNELFSKIEGVYDKRPRRWNFEQFNN